jgi:diguanylate cyclase (GGDEF)-like protein
MRLYQIRIAFSISAAHSNLDDKDAALPWLERALQIARETHWPAPLGEALATLGNFYRENGYLERSLETLAEALKWLGVAPNSRGYALAHCYAGHADLAVNSFTSAVQHGQEAVQIARRMSSWSLVVDGLIVIALGASQEGNAESALTAAREAVAITEREGMEFWRIDALRALAKVHARHTFPAPQGMDVEHPALYYLTLASDSAERLDGYGEEVALLIELAAAHEQAGDLVAALAMERRARAASVTLERRRLANRMLSSELKHEADLQRREAEYQRRLATSDALTGIPNRRYFLERAALEAKRSVRTGNSIALIMADIDRFKSINDTLGHAAGDVVIAGAAHTLAARLRAIDMVGRLGGEEFAILLPDTDNAEVVVIAERLRSDIESMTLEWNGQKVPVTMSFGCAVCAGTDAPNIETLLMQADESLYEAKKSGRNRVVLHRG